jgi:CRISPR-associated protein Cas1
MVLYLQTPGTVLRRQSRRLVVELDDRPIRQVRLRDVERVVLFSGAVATSPALASLLDEGIETVFLTPSGRLRGRLSPPGCSSVFLRLQQAERIRDPAFRLAVARTLVGAKLRNSRHLLQRYARNHPDLSLAEATERLEGIQRRVAECASMPSLLGIEGDAARGYFACLGRLPAEEFHFSRRSRRPPRDPFNALMSFGYALLLGEAVGACAGEGLDPDLGLLHELHPGRPSLALDLIEEFRAAIVDRLCLTMVNRSELKPEHFEGGPEQGVLLNEKGRSRFLPAFHQAMEVAFTERSTGERHTYRSLVRRQAARLRGAIEGRSAYVPFSPEH